MSEGVKRELTWLVISFSLFLFVGWLFNEVDTAFILYFLFYVSRQLSSMRKFERWMQGRAKKSFPPVTGFWSEVSYLVSKKQRALEKHADLNFYKSEQFRSASMLIPDAIISLNQHNKIEWFNDVSKTLVGARRQNVGNSIEVVIRHPDFIKYLRSRDYAKPITISNLNQSGRTNEFQIIPYFENHKLLVVRDITELYQLAQIRRDFIANASHELRTPLTVLKGYLEIMFDNKDEMPHWALPLEHMESQANRMQAIIEDLLTLSTIEADSITADMKKVDIPNMLMELQADSYQLASDEHELNFEIDKKLMIYGYFEPLKSVLTNLLANAVRYSPDGGLITVRWYRKGNHAVYEVQDEGLGIASEHIPRLTERFYRVDKDRSRVTGGTGLGLAIVRHVLERHRADLEIESVLGKGSLFRCKFPITKPRKSVKTLS